MFENEIIINIIIPLDLCLHALRWW